MIAATWTCTTGETVQGLDVACPDTDKYGVARVTVVDGAGNSASADIDISPAQAQ